MFYHEFGAIMMRAPVIGLEFTRYLPLALVPFVLLQVWSCCPDPNPNPDSTQNLTISSSLQHAQHTKPCPSERNLVATQLEYWLLARLAPVIARARLAHECCMCYMQVFNVFNRVLGFFIRSKRIDFDDDWEEKSELAGNGARLLRCAVLRPRALLPEASTVGRIRALAPAALTAVVSTTHGSELPMSHSGTGQQWLTPGRSVGQ